MPVCSKCGTSNRDGARFCDGCGAPIDAPRAHESPIDSSAPTTIADGRYELLQPLGEGGKKRVFAGRDTLLDREVAVALIKVEGLDATARARILREAQAMGRLGAHPCIVTVFDLGEENGDPYLVSELMTGGDLEGLLESTPDRHLPITQIVDLASGICSGLSHAHELGLVHRDLKPGNVWLTSDGRPKIGDFGLALPLERSRLTQEGTIVGTVAYLPPEQALGGDITPRADLYSLGALLYELVTGRPPFVGDDPVSVISQHINTSPVAPSWHRSGCPRTLEALVLRLLAKDPSERPASAEEVLAALETVDEREAIAQSDAGSTAADALDRVAGGVFVGRAQELGQLKAALEESLSGDGRMVTLVGEPGIGKTRTAAELATYARLRGVEVIWGRCYESQGAPPYWPWVQAIRAHVREREPEQLRAEMGSGAAGIAEFVPVVRERLPGLDPPPRFDDPQQARFHLFDSIAAYLRCSAQTRPLMLVLDDLHWADEGSLRLLEFIAHELSGARLLLIGTYRDVELSRRHPLSRTLAELTREHAFERVVLRGLSKEDVGRFVEAAYAIAPPTDLVRAVHAQTEGNPLFVTEVVRLLAQEGELTPERLESRESWSVRIPEGVREVIGRRLDRLSERCQETLTIASVIGREFESEQLRTLADDLSDDRLLDLLDEALAARVIEELPRTLGRYQFTHALIQETLVAELSLTRRVRLHARIAAALEELYGVEADLHASELVHHFGEAEALLGPDKLVHYSLLAGEAALAAYAYGQALELFQRALAAKGDEPIDDETAALLFGLGRAQVAALTRYEVDTAITTLIRAFDHYLQTGDVGRAVSVAAYPLPFTVGLGRTAYGDLVERGLALVTPASSEAGRLLAQHGWVCGLVDSDYESAQQAFRQALSIAQETNDAALERRTLANAAFVDAFHIRFLDCLPQALRSIELTQAAGDLYTELPARRAAAQALTSTGEPDGAREHLSTAFAHAEKLREPWWLASASYDLELLALYQGDWDRAREMSEFGLGTQRRDCRHLALRAILEFGTGNVDAGMGYIARLRELAASVPPPGPIADHVFLTATVAFVSRGANVDAGLDAAKAFASGVLSLPRIVPVLAATTTRGLAMIAAQEGDAQAAERLYPKVAPGRGSASMFSPLTVDRVLGLLAVTAGRIEQGVAHFEDGLAFCERAGYRPEYAWTASDYAEALLARNRPDDRRRAIALQDDALATARELGMRPLMERILSSRELLGA